MKDLGVFNLRKRGLMMVSKCLKTSNGAKDIKSFYLASERGITSNVCKVLGNVFQFTLRENFLLIMAIQKQNTLPQDAEAVPSLKDLMQIFSGILLGMLLEKFFHRKLGLI